MMLLNTALEEQLLDVAAERLATHPRALAELKRQVLTKRLPWRDSGKLLMASTELRWLALEGYADAKLYDFVDGWFAKSKFNKPVANSTPDQTRKPRGKKLTGGLTARKQMDVIVSFMEEFATTANQPFNRKSMPGCVGSDANDEGSFHWLCARIDSAFQKAPSTFKKYRAGICVFEKFAKPNASFYRQALAYIAPKYDAHSSIRSKR